MHSTNKLFTLLILLCSPAGCLNLGSDDRPLAKTTNQLDHMLETPDESIDQAPIPFNHQYLQLLEIVERMRVYIEEEIDMSFGEVTNDNSPQKENPVKSSSLIQQQQRDYIDTLYDATLDLLNDKIDINHYLYQLLDDRFAILVHRNQELESFLLSKDKNVQETNMPMPTSKDLYDFLSKNQKETQETINNEKEFSHILTKFELINLLIKESFKSCSLKELDSNTINLLRASVQLHPILAGERKDMGHLDEAGGPFALLEPLVLADEDENKAKKNLPKLLTISKASWVAEKFNNLSSETGINRNRNWLAFLGQLIFTKERLEIKNESTSFADSISPELLNFRKNLDVHIYQAHFIPKTQVFPLRNMGTPKHHKIIGAFTPYEANIWPFELPDPPFLNKTNLFLDSQAEQSTENDFITSYINSIPKKKPQLKTKISKETKQKLKYQQEPTNHTILPHFSNLDVKQKDEIFQDDQISTITRENECKKVVDAINNPEEREAYNQEDRPAYRVQEFEIPLKEGKQEDLTEPIPKASKDPSISSLLFNERLPVRGLRIFHPIRPITSHSARKLNNKHQDIVDRLFNVKQQCSVKFGEFRRVWEATGGNIYGHHRGSHRSLYDAQGINVTCGVFSHGDNQTYGKESVRYLQEALLIIGLGPSAE